MSYAHLTNHLYGLHCWEHRIEGEIGNRTMKNYDYVIIGGGMAANAAVEGIRSRDTQGTIAILTAEASKPYSRPPLSKGLWNSTPLEKIWFGPYDDRVEVLTEKVVDLINPEVKSVRTRQGDEIGYGSLLIATGAEPVSLPFSDDAIIYFRRYADYVKLKDMVDKQTVFAVIGAGFIGAELAAALNSQRKNVVLLESGQGIGWKVFPPDVVEYLNSYYEEKGVNVLSQSRIKDVENHGNRHRIILEDGKTLQVDGVVAGVGVRANTDLAENAGLSVDDGVNVNTFLETSCAKIFAAGDVAAFHSPALERVIRVEHEDNAIQMGKVAGMNMAGGRVEYDHLPMFYSDLFDIGYEAVGIIDSRLEMIPVWKEEYKKGVIYYRENGLIVGVLLWNVWDKVERVRSIIRKQQYIAQDQLKDLL